MLKDEDNVCKFMTITFQSQKKYIVIKWKVENDLEN